MIPSTGKGCPYCRDQDRELSQAWGQRWAAKGELRLGGGEGTSSPTPSPLPNPSYRKGLLDVFSPSGTMLLSSLKPALAPTASRAGAVSCILPFQVSLPHPNALSSLCSKIHAFQPGYWPPNLRSYPS